MRWILDWGEKDGEKGAVHIPGSPGAVRTVGAGMIAAFGQLKSTGEIRLRNIKRSVDDRMKGKEETSRGPANVARTARAGHVCRVDTQQGAGDAAPLGPGLVGSFIPNTGETGDGHEMGPDLSLDECDITRGQNNMSALPGLRVNQLAGNLPPGGLGPPSNDSRSWTNQRGPAERGPGPRDSLEGGRVTPPTVAPGEEDSVAGHPGTMSASEEVRKYTQRRRARREIAEIIASMNLEPAPIPQLFSKYCSMAPRCWVCMEAGQEHDTEDCPSTPASIMCPDCGSGGHHRRRSPLCPRVAETVLDSMQLSAPEAKREPPSSGGSSSGDESAAQEPGDCDQDRMRDPLPDDKVADGHQELGTLRDILWGMLKRHELEDTADRSWEYILGGIARMWSSAQAAGWSPPRWGAHALPLLRHLVRRSRVEVREVLRGSDLETTESVLRTVECAVESFKTTTVTMETMGVAFELTRKILEILPNEERSVRCQAVLNRLARHGPIRPEKNQAKGATWDHHDDRWEDSGDRRPDRSGEPHASYRTQPPPPRREWEEVYSMADSERRPGGGAAPRRRRATSAACHPAWGSPPRSTPPRTALRCFFPLEGGSPGHGAGNNEETRSPPREFRYRIMMKELKYLDDWVITFRLTIEESCGEDTLMTIRQRKPPTDTDPAFYKGKYVHMEVSRAMLLVAILKFYKRAHRSMGVHMERRDWESLPERLIKLPGSPSRSWRGKRQQLGGARKPATMVGIIVQPAWIDQQPQLAISAVAEDSSGGHRCGARQWVVNSSTLDLPMWMVPEFSRHISTLIEG